MAETGQISEVQPADALPDRVANSGADTLPPDSFGSATHSVAVNLILFEPAEIARPLPLGDARAQHVLSVLRRQPGDEFDAGIVNGARGKARLTAVAPDALHFDFTPGAEPPPLAPITLIVGLPRPQTARDILRDATTLGVQALHFVTTDKGEPSYAQSTLWNSGEWRRHVLAGAAQAFSTRVPEVTHGRSLAATVTELPAGIARCALDNYEAPRLLSRTHSGATSVALALGAERGWSAGERERLRAHGFVFAHLGERVLRTETACVAAVVLLEAKLGLL